MHDEITCTKNSKVGEKLSNFGTGLPQIGKHLRTKRIIMESFLAMCDDIIIDIKNDMPITLNKSPILQKKKKIL